MPLTSKPRAIDTDVLLDGARAALLANATIAAATAIPGTSPTQYGIYPRAAPETATAPYIILALPSVVYASSYQDPTLNTLMDVSCYTSGWSTTTVRAMLKAVLTALVDTAWTASGVNIESANIEEAGTGVRDVDVVANGVMVRGKQVTLRVRANLL
jgi:hypothetical protein